MPKMGESIMEATILRWLKQPGDTIEVDEPVLEIATDKVDSEVPSPVAGTLAEIRFQEGDVVPIDTVIAMIGTDGEAPAASPATGASSAPASGESPAPAAPPAAAPAAAQAPAAAPAPAPAAASNGHAANGAAPTNAGARFYSPLVLNIARQEGISMGELEALPGSGQGGRVTKKDILAYVKDRGAAPAATATAAPAPAPAAAPAPSPAPARSAAPAAKAPAPAVSTDGATEIIEMDRMRKLIADHMVKSKHTSPHVTSFVEADVTRIVQWREKVKKAFLEKHGEKITFTPIFIEAIVRAIADFPMVNVSVDGDRIIRHKHIHIGMAAALPNGNLIVPVIKHADRLNLVGLTAAVNDLANRARNNQLKPDEIQGGTYTLTNVGTFGNVMGTPVINQPQVAIMAAGAIRKKPAVIETPQGDFIGIRQMMFLSHAYDHRVVDGFLGGSFVRRVADYLEAWDMDRAV